mmetsp:Transcript_4722/g.13935  ORF Transcript_4722/g.13935 Transcript_4722/m.13935 type:complete len:229 (-) Transcript_4722:1676-2362(-)
MTSYAPCFGSWCPVVIPICRPWCRGTCACGQASRSPWPSAAAATFCPRPTAAAPRAAGPPRATRRDGTPTALSTCGHFVVVAARLRTRRSPLSWLRKLRRSRSRRMPTSWRMRRTRLSLCATTRASGSRAWYTACPLPPSPSCLRGWPRAAGWLGTPTSTCGASAGSFSARRSTLAPRSCRGWTARGGSTVWQRAAACCSPGPRTTPRWSGPSAPTPRSERPARRRAC